MSLVEGDFFQSCRASSEYDDNWDCLEAFNANDRPEDAWNSKVQDDRGAWIEVEFKEPILVQKVGYRGRTNDVRVESFVVKAGHFKNQLIDNLANGDHW